MEKEKRTVVIVDDEPIARLDTSEMLKELGFLVVGQGGDGIIGIELCQKYHPDIVLMDIKMPILDGLESAKMIAQAKLSPCILLITAFHDMEYIQKAKEVGVSGYLVKPINQNMLLPAIEIALEQSRLKETVFSMVQEEQDRKEIEIGIALYAKENNILKEQAQRVLQKMSMEKRTTMLALAKVIIKQYKNKDYINKAKQLLMKKQMMTEKAAYNKLRQYSEANHLTMEQSAKEYLKKGER